MKTFRIAAMISMSIASLVATAAESDGAQEMEAVIVTGSRIRRMDTETPSPVQIIGRDEIARSSEHSISEILRKVSADNQGSLPTAFSAGFATGASGISLRGLGLNSTLVLVNGRRMAAYGLADDGSRTFVDLNSIPLEAVDRIEVVKDGASAIYGSDAIAGVVNIILRENFQGAAVGGTFGTSSQGDGSHYAVNGTWGTGDVAKDRYNMFVSIEAAQDGKIENTDRSGVLGTDDLRRFGFFDNRLGAYGAGLGLFEDGTPVFSGSTPNGTYAAPGASTRQERINILSCPEVNDANGVCLTDLAGYSQIQREANRLNIYARAARQFTDHALGYLELGRFSSKIDGDGTPGGVNDSGVYNPGDPLNPTTAPHRTILPANHPDNLAGVDSVLSLLTVGLGGRETSSDSTVLRAVTGLKGDLGAWSYDMGLAYIKSSTDTESTGYIRHPLLQEALNNGTLRIDAGLTSRSLLNRISPVLKNTSTSSVSLFDATVSRELFDLPGGKFGLAVGAEYRRETTDNPPVPYTDLGEIVGLGYSAFDSNRHVTAAYVEIDAPVAKFLSLSGALRHDRYSDYGGSSTPKVGFKFTPIPQLSFRGTFSQAFRAPGPTESGNSSTLGFTPALAIITVGDPNVKPETADSYTLGFIAELPAGFNVSVDYFDIRRKNEIVSADPASIVAGLPATGAPNSRAPGAVPNSVLYYDEFGDLVTISGPFANLNKTNTSGFDVDFRHEVHFKNGGSLESSLTWTRTLSLERELADGTRFEYAGTHGPYVLSAAGGTPRDRAGLDVTWSKAAFGLTTRLTYVGKMAMIDHKGETIDVVGTDMQGRDWYSTSTGEGQYFVTDPNGIACGVYNPDGSVFNGDCNLASFTTVDMSGRWSMNPDTDFTLSINNLLGKQAPFDPYTYGGLNYNPTFHQAGAVGRFITLGVKYRF